MGGVVSLEKGKANIDRATEQNTRANQAALNSKRPAEQPYESILCPATLIELNFKNAERKIQVGFADTVREIQSPCLEHPLLRYCSSCLQHKSPFQPCT